MQGHKKLIPELKLNDNLRKLRGGVTPTPTPTPTDSNVKIYNLDVTVEYNVYTKQYEAVSSNPTLYNQIHADYQQYGDDALYTLNVNITTSGIEPLKLVIFLTKQESQPFYFGSSGIPTGCCICAIRPEGFVVIYYTKSDYDHTNVSIENGSLKVYNDIDGEYVYSEDAVAYLINNVVSLYGTNTELLFTDDTEDGFCTLNNTSHITLDGNLVYIVSGYKGDKPISLILYRNVQTSECGWFLNGGSVKWNINNGNMNVLDDNNNAVQSSSFYKLLSFITYNNIQNIKFNLHVDIKAKITDYIGHPITFTEWSLQYNNSVDCMTSTVYVAALDKHITIFIPIDNNSTVYYQVV